MIKYVLFLSLLTACGGGPTAPTFATAPASQSYPAALQPVFDLLDNDDWRHPLLGGQAMGAWVRRHLHRIDMDWSLAPTVGARAIIAERRILWHPRVTIEAHGTAELAGMLLHEVKHLSGNVHSCGDHDGAGDRTMEEGGAYAIQILYLEHAGYLQVAESLRATSIGCR